VHYGGRGISVCEEWEDFFAFQQWAENNGYGEYDEEGLVKDSIERNDVDGIYDPANCSWISKDKQWRNKQNSMWITAWDETQLLIDWMDDRRRSDDLQYQTIRERLERGWSPEDAISLPLGSGRSAVAGTWEYLTAFDETKSMRAWADDDRCQVDYQLLYERIAGDGWDPEEAITTPSQKGVPRPSLLAERHNPTIGRRFGRWVIIAKVDRQGFWWGRCDCGTEKEVKMVSLMEGTSTSCGCSKLQYLTVGDETMSIADWSRHPDCPGLAVGTIRKRLQDGWDVEEAIFTPVLRPGRKKPA
jgi:hypothetical protein